MVVMNRVLLRGAAVPAARMGIRLEPVHRLLRSAAGRAIKGQTGKQLCMCGCTRSK